jgi:hypothetical protein
MPMATLQDIEELKQRSAQNRSNDISADQKEHLALELIADTLILLLEMRVEKQVSKLLKHTRRTA